MKFLLRWVITVAALFVAARIVPGIRIEGTNAWIAYAVMALVLGLINAFLRPLLQLVSIGFIIVTLGLFLLVINAFTLWLAAWISVNLLDVGFRVDGFGAAFWGSLIVSIVSFLLSLFVKD